MPKIREADKGELSVAQYTGLEALPISSGSSESKYVTTATIGLAAEKPWSKITDTPTTLAGYGITDLQNVHFVSQYASLSDALSSIGSTETTLFIDESVDVSTDTTIPSTLSIVVLKGGIFNRTGGTHLTINGAFECGRYQCFDDNTSGHDWVQFGAESGVVPIPQWWGAIGNGTTDCSTAVYCAIEACRSLNNAGVYPELVFHEGQYRITFAKGSSDSTYYTNIATKSFYHFQTGTGSTDWLIHSPEFQSPNDYGIRIRGIGKVVLLADGDTNSWLFSNTSYFSYDIENITIRAYDDAETVHGWAHLQMVHSTWRNVTFENFKNGVAHYLGNSIGNKFYDYNSHYNQRATVLGKKGETTRSSAACNANHWYGVNLGNNGTNLTDSQSLTNGFLEIVSAENVSFTGGVFQTNLSPILITEMYGVSFNHIYMEYTCNGRAYDTGYSTTFSIDPTQSALSEFKTMVSGLSVNDCFISSGGSQWIQFKANSTHLVDNISANNVQFGNFGKGYAYYTGSIPYISGIVETNCSRYDELTRETTPTSYPPQYELNPSTQAQVSSSNYRVLDIFVTNQKYLMGITPNVRPCSFHASGGTHSNVTGDGTWYTLLATTKIYDGNGDYNTSTGKFTAPVRGYYEFHGYIYIQGLGYPTGFTYIAIELSKNGVTPTGQYRSVEVNASVGGMYGNATLPYNGAYYLQAGDTVEVAISISGGAKTVNINGNSSFYGHLVR